MRRFLSAGITLSALTLVLGTATASQAQTFDFTGGLGTGTTAYTATAAPSGNTATGTYRIVTNVTQFNTNLVQPLGGTASGGNFLVFDGSTVAGTNLFSFTTTAATSGFYNFSFYGAAGGSPVPTFAASFGVGSTAPNTTTSLGSVVATNTWSQFTSSNFSLTAGTTYTFTILDSSTVGGGNDGAIDDVKLTLVTSAPEPGSLALLLPVMGTVGMMLRRRKK